MQGWFLMAVIHLQQSRSLESVAQIFCSFHNHLLTKKFRQDLYLLTIALRTYSESIGMDGRIVPESAGSMDSV